MGIEEKLPSGILLTSVEKLAGYIAKHTSGLDVLPAPLRPEDAELVTESKLASNSL